MGNMNYLVTYVIILSSSKLCYNIKYAMMLLLRELESF